MTDRPVEENASENIALHDNIPLACDNTTQYNIIETEIPAMRCIKVNQAVKRLSPFQIRPIPTMAAPKTARKNKRQKVEVLTSSSV